jgi:2-succinyl-5-enolpyruvyl-6-hydroxy-3-cyclohexene-1-carboxylate synthase
LAGLDAWQVGVERDGSVFDPDGTLNALLMVEPAALCQAVAEALGADADASSPGDWYREWVHADAEAASAVRDVLCRHQAPTEPAVARDVVAAVPTGGNLVVSSSMPVRDVEWFSAPREGIHVLANRGANGIDGVVSTAAGVALASGAPTVLLIGDVALLHDTNGLLGLAGRPLDLCIVAIDNDGGGIFEFLPPADELDRSRFEQLFGTPHGVDLAALAGAHGIASTTVAEQTALADAVAKAFAAGGSHLVVVPTDRRHNVDVHRACNDAVAAAVEAMG